MKVSIIKPTAKELAAVAEMFKLPGLPSPTVFNDLFKKRVMPENYEMSAEESALVEKIWSFQVAKDDVQERMGIWAAYCKDKKLLAEEELFCQAIEVGLDEWYKIHKEKSPIGSVVFDKYYPGSHAPLWSSKT
jgi:hypothetical protein